MKISRITSLLGLLAPAWAFASEANLVLPDLSTEKFIDGAIDGRTLLIIGIVVSAIGLVFSFVQFNALKNLPVHKAMREISELIYETCKTYLVTQGKFILFLEVFIGAVIILYFGLFDHATGEAAKVPTAARVAIIVFFSLVGIAGS